MSNSNPPLSLLNSGELQKQLMHTMIKTYRNGKEYTVQLGTLISYGHDWETIMSLFTTYTERAVEKIVLDVIGEDENIQAVPMGKSDIAQLGLMGVRMGRDFRNRYRATQREHLHKIMKGE